MLTLTKPRLILASIVVLALALVWYGAGTLLGQDDTIPDCPEGQRCVQIPYWPPFTAVYETYPDHSFNIEGIDYTPLVTYRLEWRSMVDWTATIIDSERFEFDGFILDMTGSYESVDGRTRTVYDSVFGDEPHVRTLNEGAVVAPPGGVFLQVSRRYRDADLPFSDRRRDDVGLRRRLRGRRMPRGAGRRPRHEQSHYDGAHVP